MGEDEQTFATRQNNTASSNVYESSRWRKNENITCQTKLIVTIFSGILIILLTACGLRQWAMNHVTGQLTCLRQMRTNLWLMKLSIVLCRLSMHNIWQRTSWRRQTRKINPKRNQLMQTIGINYVKIKARNSLNNIKRVKKYSHSIHWNCL